MTSALSEEKDGISSGRGNVEQGSQKPGNLMGRDKPTKRLLFQNNWKVDAAVSEQEVSEGTYWLCEMGQNINQQNPR